VGKPTDWVDSPDTLIVMILLTEWMATSTLYQEPTVNVDDVRLRMSSVIVPDPMD
jgi:hypothetical protein